jgi:hypothetical protein
LARRPHTIVGLRCFPSARGDTPACRHVGIRPRHPKEVRLCPTQKLETETG